MVSYTFETKLTAVKGVGPTVGTQMAKQGLLTVVDLLLYLPLRYEDRTHNSTISQLYGLLHEHSSDPTEQAATKTAGQPKPFATIKATVKSVGQRWKGRMSIQAATVTDETGSLKLSWFNSPYLVTQLQRGQTYFFSGTYDSKFHTLTQAKVEKATSETIHTNRLVPVYSSSCGVKPGSLRRLLKNVLDQLAEVEDPLAQLASVGAQPQALAQPSLTPNLVDVFSQLHFPDTPEKVVAARERLALEEFLSLMQHSERVKAQWRELGSAKAITIGLGGRPDWLPTTLPYQLTNSQNRACEEILADLQQTTPMNRLLIGDVGAGKTVVAGVAAQQMLLNGGSVAMVAPTRILAQQHAQTLSQLLPDLPIQLMTAQTHKKSSRHKSSQPQTRGSSDQPQFYIGTHAVLNRLPEIQPALIIYDEQHRFGVRHRSSTTTAQSAHVLTMSATPIPRTLMLTLFAHLSMSYLDELPPGRLPVKTWVIPETKRESAYEWIGQQSEQVLVVCPFIDPSAHEAFENVAAASETYEKVVAYFSTHSKPPRIALLHGRTPKREQETLLKDLYELKIDILVTTPIVEVGVDLPQASIMVIENAERFGLSSLHQLRGRVGRAGQQGYCLLFSQSRGADTQKRLRFFAQETNGLKLAEEDLQTRGSGELFGTQQSGFSELRFGSWANLELIARAKMIYEQLPPGWKPVIPVPTGDETDIPLAN